MLGGSHFFCENRSVPVLTLCYENLIGSLVFWGGLVRPNQVIKIFIFSKFTQFSNRVVLAYIITVSSHVKFSQPNSRIF